MGRGGLTVAVLIGVVAAASGEREQERALMVRTQMAEPGDGREPVRDRSVLAAMQAVPRHAFVPAERSAQAYDDTPLPIGWGQTISQPYIVAVMTELLALQPESRVLEVGTGSGYQAAVLEQLCRHVYTIEIVQPLAARAAAVLQKHAPAVHARQGDGYFGWPDAAPFDAIVVTAAAGHLPQPLWEQLKPGGRMVIPIGGPYEVQRLVLVEKTLDGKRRSRAVSDVRFVPLAAPAASP